MLFKTSVLPVTALCLVITMKFAMTNELPLTPPRGLPGGRNASNVVQRLAGRCFHEEFRFIGADPIDESKLPGIHPCVADYSGAH